MTTTPTIFWFRRNRRLIDHRALTEDGCRDYVHRYVPELAGVTAPTCLGLGGGSGAFASCFAVPIVDVGRGRLDALARFYEARELARTSS